MDLPKFNAAYSRVKQFYLGASEVNRRCRAVQAVIQYGYLPVPYEMAREELSDADLFGALERLWEKQGVMRAGVFGSDFNPLQRLGYVDPSWIFREGHKLETLNLLGLTEVKDGKIGGNFRNFLIKIVTTAPGCEREKIPATTFYLLPPYQRDPIFGSAYCPASSEIEPALADPKLKEELGLDAEHQLWLFIGLARMSGHPVLLDLLPQAGRFAKVVLANPECFRWFYLPDLIDAIESAISEVAPPIAADYPLPPLLREAAVYALKEDLEGSSLQLGESDPLGPSLRSGPGARTLSGIGNLKAAMRSVHHELYYSILLQAKKQEKAGLTGEELRERMIAAHEDRATDEIRVRFRLPQEVMPLVKSCFQLFTELDFALQQRRIDYCNIMFLKQNQCKIAGKVRELIAENADTSHEPGSGEHVELIGILQQRGLWPLPGGSWNSAGHPIFHRMSPDQTPSPPRVDHYDYQCRLVNAFAGDMDIVTPWYFAFLEQRQDNLNRPVISKYVEYCSEIYQRLTPDGFRIDHIDHSADYPVSVDEMGNPKSYRAPLKVFSALAQKIRRIDPTFALLAEYMGWGDMRHPHLFHEYHGNGIQLGISTDVVGEYRNNAQVMIEEGNEVIEQYNREVKSPYFSLARVFDNHDRIHPDIAPALSEFTEERALLKWCKCLMLPGGGLAQRPVVYLDGNQTHTMNQAFASTFLAFNTLHRAKNYRFFARFDALLRFSLAEPSLMYGKAVIIPCTSTEGSQRQPHNTLSAWAITLPPPYLSALLIVAHEWIDDHTPDLVPAGSLVIPIPSGYLVQSELFLPDPDVPQSLPTYLEELPKIAEIPYTGSHSPDLVLPIPPPNHFRMFRLVSR